MRVPSNRMPKRATKTLGWFGTSAVLVALAGILASPGVLWWPLAFVLPVLFTVATWSIWRQNDRTAKSRADESICDFARSFDYRRIDTWIIRAVYEEFSDSYPIRAKDSFEHDLLIDPEDFEYAVVDIADRTGRSLNGFENNPMYDRVDTVHDLVMFFQFQPISGSRGANSGNEAKASS